MHLIDPVPLHVEQAAAASRKAGHALAGTEPPAGVPAETPPPGHPAGPGRAHLHDGPAITPATVATLACNATISTMVHDQSGNITTAHGAAITPATIIPPHSGGRLNLSLAIWTALANARVNAERQQTRPEA